MMKVLNIVILVFLVSTMFSAGLGLTMRQILSPLRNVHLVLSSIGVSYVIVPLIAIAVTRIISLEEPLKIGLILFSMAAGAEAGPKLTGMAKGNEAFAVGLLIMQLCITIVYIPVIISLVLPEVQIETGKLLIKLVTGVCLPLASGLFLKSRYEAAADRICPSMHRISTLFMMLMAVLLIGLNITEILRLANSGAITAALIFIAAAFLAGYLFGGPGQDNRRALGLMSGARNASISLMIATQVFNDPKVLLMITTTVILMLIVLLPAVLWFGRRAS